MLAERLQRRVFKLAITAGCVVACGMVIAITVPACWLLERLPGGKA